MSAPDADSLAATVHDRLRQVQGDGTAIVDALLNFMKERAALEETYSKQLAKLSKHTLALNGKSVGAHIVWVRSKLLPVSS